MATHALDRRRPRINDYLAGQSDSSTYDDLLSPLSSIEQQECILPTSPVGAIHAINGWGMSVRTAVAPLARIVAISGAHALLDTAVAANQLCGGEGVISYEAVDGVDETFDCSYRI